MKIEKFKHTGEIISGNVYVPKSIFNELKGDKKKIWEYITCKNAIIYVKPDGSGFEKVGKNNDLGEVDWVNDESTYLRLLL